MPPGAIESDEQLWEMMADTIRKAGYEGKAGFQCDCASDTYYDREKKLYHGLFGKNDKTRDEMLELYKYAVKNYPFVILEDPFYEDDYESHAHVARSDRTYRSWATICSPPCLRAWRTASR